MSEHVTGHAAFVPTTPTKAYPAVVISATVLPFKLEYSAAEFAPLVGLSAETLQRPKYWRRYGGRKRGGRIVFSYAAAQAIADGRR